eukprot:8881083-Karenia_brevis.AAC.1
MKGKYELRSRMVARSFKGGDKDRDDLFAETPPMEAKRLLMSRAVTRRKGGRSRKLPEECHCPLGHCFGCM